MEDNIDEFVRHHSSRSDYSGRTRSGMQVARPIEILQSRSGILLLFKDQMSGKRKKGAGGGGHMALLCVGRAREERWGGGETMRSIP